MVRHTSEFEPGDWSNLRSRSDTGDEVPRSIVALGALAAVAIVVALLRYAVDLLGLVSIIVLVGFSIRTITDWLTDGESVSGWSLVAVLAGAVGTAAAGLWLFGSDDLDRVRRVEQRLPAGFTRAIEWAEARGWGGRVLLPDTRALRTAQSDATAAPRVSALGSRATRPARRTALDRAASTPDATASRASPSAGVPATSGGPTSDADGPYATTTLLMAAPARSVVGLSVRLTADVATAGGAARPQGIVVFRRGSIVIGSAPLEAAGVRSVAHLSTVDLPVGSHELVAEYVGGGRFSTSRSAVVRQTVVKE
jgi:hypothetical protein